MRTTVQITLVVKGDAREALEQVNRRLLGPISSWLGEDVDVKPPYADGSLLWYGIPEKRDLIVS